MYSFSVVRCRLNWSFPFLFILIKVFIYGYTMPIDLFIFTSWAKLRSLKISFFFLVFFFLKGALLKSSYLSSFDHISSQNGWFTSQIWYDDFPFRKFIRFPDFFRIFPDFLSNLQISSQNRWFTSQVLYDDFRFLKFILFPDFFPDFSGFSSYLQIYSHNWWFMMIFLSRNLSGIFSDFHLIFRFLVIWGFLFPGFFSGFQIFSGFFRIFIRSSGFFTEWVIYFWIFFRIFPDFQQIFRYMYYFS